MALQTVYFAFSSYIFASTSLTCEIPVIAVIAYNCSSLLLSKPRNNAKNNALNHTANNLVLETCFCTEELDYFGGYVGDDIRQCMSYSFSTFVATKCKRTKHDFIKYVYAQSK